MAVVSFRASRSVVQPDQNQLHKNVLTDGTVLQFDWWIVLLNLVAFCLVGVYTILGPRCSNIGVVALLAVVTTLNMIRCDGKLWLHCHAISRCRIFSAQAHLL